MQCTQILACQNIVIILTTYWAVKFVDNISPLLYVLFIFQSVLCKANLAFNFKGWYCIFIVLFGILTMSYKCGRICVHTFWWHSIEIFTHTPRTCVFFLSCAVSCGNFVENSHFNRIFWKILYLYRKQYK